MTNKRIPPEAKRYIALAEQAYRDFDYQDSIKYRKIANQIIKEQNNPN